MTETALPPGPRMPRALQTAIWFRRAQWMMAECRKRFGETFRLTIAHEGTWVMLSNPEDVKTVFTGDPRLLNAGEANRILLPILGEHSLLLLDGSEHMAQRKLMLPSFHGARMQSYGALMADIARAEIERWPSGTPIRVRPRMQAVTLEIILRAVFGLDEGERLITLRVELRRVLDRLTDPRWVGFLIALGPERIPSFPPFARQIERLDLLIYSVIAARRAEGNAEQRDDILSMLLSAAHEDGSPMTDRELRDELLTLLVAGHETTATALAWAVERLARHPDKLRRLSCEVRAGKEEYLRAVVYETLRLRPVISLVNRTLKAPMEFGGYELPAGVKVVPSIYLVHRRPEIYPEPERFLPERFLSRPPGTYTWIPFGGGVRRCLGGAFAQYEMEVVLRELATRTAIDPARARSERVYRRAITETPRYDAEVILSGASI
ncbi:MAG TPA: cytochrome P450 [Solirubrobacteraceae bacterium]|nr:cytochrome P450 [Solirubrobacteraceae bacterium]